MGEKLGQNFLVNKEIVKKIIEAANLKPDDLVLEIGPGKGILTEELAKKAGRIIAVEIDNKLADLLKNKFSTCKNITIIDEDILKINLRQLISNFEFLISNQIPISNNLISKQLKSPKKLQTNKLRNYKLIANIPYYITAPIIRKFLESENPPSEMILMVQKEVAERICEKPGKMSILAVSVQYYAQPEMLFNVSRENFDPVPEVDSAVIKIIPHPIPLPKKGEGDFSKEFFRVVRAGFCAKRKMLVNNLSNSFHLDKKTVEEKLKRVGISSRARAQELSVDDWKKLAELFF